MRKKERFVVYGYVKGFFNGSERLLIEKCYLDDFENYPTDEELEHIWNLAKKEYTAISFLNVEKQVRFN